MNPLLQSLAATNKAIVYRPEFNKITGSVTASILLSQVIYWASVSNGDAFYKFQKPCKNKLYKDGDSWTEELGFSKNEFMGAIAKIGSKVTKGVSKNDLLAGDKVDNLVIYWTDKSRVTWWLLNVPLAERLISGIYICKSENRNYIEKSENRNYGVSPKTGITYSSTENNSKNTFIEEGKDKPEGKAKGKVLDPYLAKRKPGRTNDPNKSEAAIAAIEVLGDKWEDFISSVAKKSLEWSVADYGYTDNLELRKKLIKRKWLTNKYKKGELFDHIDQYLDEQKAKKQRLQGPEGSPKAFLDKAIELAKQNPSEAQKLVKLEESVKGYPENFYWNKVLKAL